MIAAIDALDVAARWHALSIGPDRAVARCIVPGQTVLKGAVYGRAAGSAFECSGSGSFVRQLNWTGTIRRSERRTRMRRILLAGALCTAFLAVAGCPAAADCLGPTIEIAQRKIAPGEEIKVSGSGWGDNCYDTGPPPGGEGVLGVPINGIEIFVVQGDREWLVAAGSADAHYRFAATVTAPGDLTLGDARLQAARVRVLPTARTQTSW